MSQTTHKSIYSTMGLVVVGILFVTIIWLANSTLRGMRLDLTENKLYTLSEGTHSILKKIDEPITFYYFFSKDVARGLPSISTYAQRVQEMLEEMSQSSNGKIKLSVIDPEPFSDEEDRAVELGIQGIPLSSSNETLYFGLAATNAVGDNASVPYFSSKNQSLLEYDLSKLIYQLNQAKKPVVGLLSALKMDGGFDQRTMEVDQPWVVLEQLRQFFEVRKLGESTGEIPQDVNLLMLVHPAGLDDKTRYAIDQYVLGGGHALIFVDPYAESATGMEAMQAGQSPQSDLPGLFKAWGVQLKPDTILGDAKNALQVTSDPSKAPTRHYAILGLGDDSLDKEDVITQGLERIHISYMGILEPVADATTKFTPIISSSNQSAPLPSSLTQMGTDPAELQRGFKPTGETYTIAARISGNVKTAFPDGPPAADDTKQEEDAAGDEKDNAEETTKQDPQKAQLTESKQPINVVVIADTDVLTDRLWVRTNDFFGKRLATPFADNADLAVNAVDNLLGSSDLISIRSRASYSRPFDRVDALRLDAESRYRAKEEELQARLDQTQQKIDQLQQQKGDQGNAGLILNTEQRDAVQGFQQELVKTRKELRSVRHELNKSIEGLGTLLKFINIVLVPLLLTIGVIVFNIVRRKKTQPVIHSEAKA